MGRFPVVGVGFDARQLTAARGKDFDPAEDVARCDFFPAQALVFLGDHLRCILLFHAPAQGRPPHRQRVPLHRRAVAHARLVLQPRLRRLPAARFGAGHVEQLGAARGPVAFAEGVELRTVICGQVGEGEKLQPLAIARFTPRRLAALTEGLHTFAE